MARRKYLSVCVRVHVYICVCVCVVKLTKHILKMHLRWKSVKSMEYMENERRNRTIFVPSHRRISGSMTDKYPCERNSYEKRNYGGWKVRGRGWGSKHVMKQYQCSSPVDHCFVALKGQELLLPFKFFVQCCV